MKKKHLPLIALCILIASLTSSLAIEGIQVSIQSSNVVLSWPSLTNETYIAQYRKTLAATDSWVTLTNFYPAAQTTNLTSLVLSNSVNFGTPGSGGGTNGGGGISPPIPEGTNDDSGGGGSFGVPGTGFYQVVRNGAHMWGITNGMIVSNVLLTPIEFAVGTTDQIVDVTFCDTNDVPISGAYAEQGANGGWWLDWNTTQAFNGQYAICAEINFASTNSVISAPVTVTVNNPISFPNVFSQVYGDQMWIYATTIPDASFEVDVYGETNNYIGSFNGNADDTGTISFLWNFVDGDGITHDDTNFLGVFTVDTSSEPEISPKVTSRAINSASFLTSTPLKKTPFNKFKGPHPNGGGIVATESLLWVKEGNWTPNNNWVVAYGLFNGQTGESPQNDQYMIAGGAGDDTEDGGVFGTLDEYGLRGNISPGNNVTAGTVFTVDDADSRADLLSYLGTTKYENFYFFGHGNDSAIGSYNGYILTRSQIAYALGNVPLTLPNPIFTGDPSGPPPTVVSPINPTDSLHAALHPYRFVYIDACDTGAGHLSESFGIPTIPASTNFFASAGVESRVFIGFTSWKLNLNIFGWQSYSALTGAFLTDWLTGVSAQTCVANAENDVHTSGAHMDSSAVIYGAVDLTVTTRTRP
jgi:hypothetical protein